MNINKAQFSKNVAQNENNCILKELTDVGISQEHVHMFFFSKGSRRNMAVMTHRREESSEDMNKGAEEMDEGSEERQAKDRDGWSEEPACTGATPWREFTDAQRRSSRRFGKMTSQEVVVGGDNEQRQSGGVCLGAKRERGPRGRRTKEMSTFTGGN